MNSKTADRLLGSCGCNNLATEKVYVDLKFSGELLKRVKGELKGKITMG